MLIVNRLDFSNRRIARRAQSWRAAAILLPSRRVVLCIVENVCEGGAQINTGTPTRLPEKFDLYAVGSQREGDESAPLWLLKCYLTRHRSSRIGVKFLANAIRCEEPPLLIEGALKEFL